VAPHFHHYINIKQYYEDYCGVWCFALYGRPLFLTFSKVLIKTRRLDRNAASYIVWRRRHLKYFVGHVAAEGFIRPFIMIPILCGVT